MEYIYSAMVLHAAGKDVTDEGITKILEAVGITPEPSRVKALTASLKDVNIADAIASAAVMPVAAPAGAAPAAASAPETSKPKKEKKEEKKEEEEEGATEEEAAAGLGALFG